MKLAVLFLLWATPAWSQQKPDVVRALLADPGRTWAARADSLAVRDASASEWQRLAGRLVEQLRQHQLAVDQLVKLEKNQCDYWIFHAGCITAVIGPGLAWQPETEVDIRILQLTIGIPINIPWLSGSRQVQMDSVRVPSMVGP